MLLFVPYEIKGALFRIALAIGQPSEVDHRPAFFELAKARVQARRDLTFPSTLPVEASLGFRRSDTCLS